MNPTEKKGILLFREEAGRSVLFGMFVIVTLWVSIDVTDSTILKPYLLAGFAFLGVALYLGRSLGQGRIVWQRSPADVWISASLLGLFLSWGLSEYRIFGAESLLLAISSAVCFFSGSQLFDERRRVERVLDVISIVAPIVCIIALLQFVAGDRWGIDFGLGSSRRVMSTMGNSTYLAGFLAMMIPLTLGRALSGNRPGRTLAMAALIALMAVVMVLTQSRSGILALAGSLLLLVLLRYRRNPRAIVISLLVAAGVFGLLLLVVPNMVDRLVSLLNPAEDSSFARRIPFWRAGWDAILSAPLFGHGPGSVPHVIAAFRDPGYWMNGSEDIVPHVHNELLEVALESGFIGVLCVCVIAAHVLRQGFRQSEKNVSILATGLSCGLVAIILDNLTGVSLRHAPVAMFAWFFAGLLFSPAFRGERSATRALPFNGSRVAALLPLGAWVVLVLFLGDAAVSRLGSDTSVQSGRIAARAGKHQIAAGHFRMAVEEDATYLIASYELCVAQLRTGAYRDALRTGEEIRNFAPDYPKVRLLESLALLELDSLNQALRAVKEELTRRDHPEAFYTRSLIAARLDDTVGVRTSLEKVLERNIAAYSSIHLEGACRTLLEIAQTKEDLERLGSLLEQLGQRIPANASVNATLAEVRRRLRQKPTV